MKILPVHSNYIVRKEKINHVNSIQNMSKPYASDTVSFGAKLVTAEENQHLGEVKTRIYHGKKGSVADYVEAAKVILEDGARIKNFQAKKGRYPNYEELIPVKDIKNIEYIDAFLFDNAQIDNVLAPTDGTVSIHCYAKKAEPQIVKTNKGRNKCCINYIYSDDMVAQSVINNFNTVFEKNSKAENVKTFSLNLSDNAYVKNIESKDGVFLDKDSKADKIYCSRDVVLLNNSGAEKIESRLLNLYNNAKVKNIKARKVKIEDSTRADNIVCEEFICNGNSSLSDLDYRVKSVKTKTAIIREHSIIKNLEAETAEIKDAAEIQNIAVRDSLLIKNNAKISNLELLKESTELQILDESKIKNIKGKKISLNLNKAFDNIEAENVKLFGTIKANNLETQNADISENVKINTIKVKDKLVLKDNAEVNNIIVTGDNPEIIINGNVKINGQIIFENTEGTVIVKSDSMGKLPAIRSSQVKNGKIGGDYKPVGFEKVVGMDDLKKMLYEDVINPSSRAQDYIDYGLEPVNGFLLYGPPGCGKTFIINALAEETGRYFVNMPASTIGSPYKHETSINIAKKFQEAINNAPSIIFIDEVESIAPTRENLAGWDVSTNEQVTELLQQINNCKDKDVFVVFASNEPQKIDNAIKRTGRIDKKIYLGPPDMESRKAMFERNLKTISKKENNIDTTKLAELTNNYTAEDIRMVVRQASVFAMRNSKNISLDDLVYAIAITKPSLTDSMVESYKRKGELI